MRIQELEIDRFGVWKDVTIPFHAGGVTVLYGPNEAGKSTLMRFIRGVLYGYQPADEIDAGRSRERVICAGALKVSHAGETLTIRRLSERGTRGRLEINGKTVEQNSELMQDLLGAASESLFKDVFAIGLHELQQLATLSNDEVSEQIYGLSLGREGEQIVRAQNAFQKGQQFLVDAEHHQGEIFSLIQRLSEIDRELERVGQPAQRHTRLNDQIQKHDVSVSELKRQQKNLQHDLSGYQFLTRVWEPWSKQQRLQRQLDRLPATTLDVEILNRFDEMELELSEVDTQRKRLIEEAKRLQKQAEEIRLRPELEEQICAVQNLHEQVHEMQLLEQRLQGKKNGPDLREGAIQQLLAGLDGRWDLQRLEAADLSPKSLHQLLSCGDAYRRANQLRTKAARRYKKMATKLKQLEQHALQQSRGRGSAPVERQRNDLLQRIEELENLRGLRVRQSHLQKTSTLFPESRDVETVQQELPPYFYYVLWFFAVAGGILLLSGSYGAMHGLVVGGFHAAIIGACYALLGIASLGTCWTMKQFFSRQTVRVADFDSEREKIDRELKTVEAQIQRVHAKQLLRPQRTGPQTNVADRDEALLIEETLAELRTQLHQLDHQEDNSAQIERLRQRMSGMRSRLQDDQKRVSRTRREWTDVLRKRGLSETLKVGEAVAQCQLLADAQETLVEWSRTHQTTGQDQRQLDQFLEKVQQLSSRIEGRGIAVRDPYQLLSEWQRELAVLGERRRERAQLRSTAKEKRREAARLVDKIERMREQRSVLLSQLGVSDRGEIAAKLAAMDERKTLTGELQKVEHELRKITESEPDLVVTEDLLVDYEETANRQRIQEIRQELQNIDETLQREYQTLGKLKQELHDIEEDRSVSSLRFDREQVADALRKASESLLAYRVADRVVDRLREQIEQDRQPETLQTAAEYLSQLTCGKYRNIWTPLNEKVLLVDDDAKQAFRVDQLSSGTREQVFLALRLAMIKDFATQGIELPMILDDVTVNFDQIRTEAAVETLLRVAGQGQQIMMFTCHLHLAHLFEQDGIEPVWLPAHRPELSV